MWTERSPGKDSPATLLVAQHIPDDNTSDTPPSSTKQKQKIAAFDLVCLFATRSRPGPHHPLPCHTPADVAECVAGLNLDHNRLRQAICRRSRRLEVVAPLCARASPAAIQRGGVCCRPIAAGSGSVLMGTRYRLVIFSNQGGLTLHADPKSKGPKAGKDRVTEFKQKCSAVLSQLGLPITLYAATGKDIYRKPRPGMWAEMMQDLALTESDIDREASLFVGDAGGRTATPKGSNASATTKDFSCSDRNLAHNVNLKYQTPEEFFLGDKPRAFARDFDPTQFLFTQDEDEDGGGVQKSEKQDIILLCGSPGAGKSTFYWKHLKPLGYERVNQDVLKRLVYLPIPWVSRAPLTTDSKDKCFKAANDFLREGDSIVIGKAQTPFRVDCLLDCPLTREKTTQIPTQIRALSGSPWRVETKSPSDASGSRRRGSCASTTMRCGP